MIRSFLRKRRAQTGEPQASVPPGERIYAIGDIHGRLDLLDLLLRAIADDEEARGGPLATLIFLGDLIDRGPQSAQVVDRLLGLAASRPGTRFLLGNHEEVFLLALSGDPKAMRFFNRIGGRETILSYGVDEQAYREATHEELRGLLSERVPQAHIDFLQTFEDLILVGDYAFVHAGVRPGLALTGQKTSDLRWIRDEFLGAQTGFEKIIVHGHSIAAEVEQTPHRIGLDTGAFASGRLSAMGFEGHRRWILQSCLT